MAKPRIGIALCGSYCTYDKLFSQLVLLSDKYELVPIMSETAAATDTRFGKASDFLSRLESLLPRPSRSARQSRWRRSSLPPARETPWQSSTTV